MTLKEDILKALFKNSSKPISGEELARELHVSRTAVWKHVQALRRNGYVIDSSPNLGYSLRNPKNLLLPKSIKDGLKTSFIGHKIYYYDEVDSTNTLAKKIAKTSEEGTIVIAETQTGGRGRLGRKWISPMGGVWLSIILKPQIPVAQAPDITLISGLAAAKAIRRYALDAKIKWPNDVLIKGKKVCGILTEIGVENERISYIIVGIGVDANVDIESFPEEIREGSTSLRRELGREINRVEFVQGLLQEFETAYNEFKQRGFPGLLEEWRRLSATIGEWVQIATPNKTLYGRAIGVDSQGALIVETEDGVLEKIIAGECIHVKR